MRQNCIIKTHQSRGGTNTGRKPSRHLRFLSKPYILTATNVVCQCFIALQNFAPSSRHHNSEAWNNLKLFTSTINTCGYTRENTALFQCNINCRTVLDRVV